MIKDYYGELHIHAKAVPELINSSYKILKEKYKRDIHPEELESWMSGLDEAYQILSDSEKRKKYDQVYFQEFGGIAELEKRLNKHKGILIALTTVFAVLLIVAVYFLFIIKPPTFPFPMFEKKVELLRNDMAAFKLNMGNYPKVMEPTTLRKKLKTYSDDRNELFWNKMTKYETTDSGDYRITFDIGGGSFVIVTKDRVFTN